MAYIKIDLKSDPEFRVYVKEMVEGTVKILLKEEIHPIIGSVIEQKFGKYTESVLKNELNNMMGRHISAFIKKNMEPMLHDGTFQSFIGSEIQHQLEEKLAFDILVKSVVTQEVKTLLDTTLNDYVKQLIAEKIGSIEIKF
jgi:uncharacterized membrane-anchored protein YjiN (DUF445 family)